jgi:hypothetical protein
MGYEINRFIGLSDQLIEELKCGICLEIFRKPIVTHCCRQTFCEDCIKSWLRSHNLCPFDRQPITSQQLLQPQRLVTNILDKLDIRCSFESNGCKEVLKLGQLSQHLVNECDYNPERVCRKCDLKIGSDFSRHNCVQNLIQLNKSLKENLKRIESEKQTKVQKYLEFGLKIQNLEKEIKFLSEENSNLKNLVKNCIFCYNKSVSAVKLLIDLKIIIMFNIFIPHIRY